MKPFREFLRLILIFLFLCVISSPVYSQLLTIDEIKITHKDTKSFDDDVLISALGIKKSDVYKPKLLSENIYKLKKFYFDNGFFDSKIDTNVKYNLKDEEVYIEILIKENKHYKIDSLIYTGLDSLPAKIQKSLSKIKEIKSNDFYDKLLVLQQTNTIIDMLQNNGFMNARLKEDSSTVVTKYSLSASDRLTVTLNFQGADTIYYFGKTKIEIEENKYGVDKELFKTEITYNEGDIYSKEKKLESEGNMAKIPIVQTARITPSEINKGKVDFTATIILSKKIEISPFGNATYIDNIFYLGGGVQYINKYFLGGGKILNLSFDGLFHSLTINRVEFSGSITKPHVFNNESYLTDKVTVGLYNETDSKNYYLGNLTSYLQAFRNYTFYNNASVDLTEELLRIKYDTTTGNPMTMLNTILSLTVVHDNTNSPASPSRGFYQSITVGSGGLLPKLVIDLFKPNVYYSEYLKLFTSNNFYLNLSRNPGNTVLATKFIVGDIIEYGKGKRLVPLPPFYKFFSGGGNSVRGWGAKDNGVLANTNDGGDFLIEGSVELRRKLFPGAENFTKNIGYAVFFDYGNVWPSDEDYRWDQIALAIGFGVRYNIFIGPLRVDFGFKLYDPSTGVNPWLFNDFSNIVSNRLVVHFGIGEAF